MQAYIPFAKKSGCAGKKVTQECKKNNIVLLINIFVCESVPAAAAAAAPFGARAALPAAAPDAAGSAE